MNKRAGFSAGVALAGFLFTGCSDNSVSPTAPTTPIPQTQGHVWSMPVVAHSTSEERLQTMGVLHSLLRLV